MYCKKCGGFINEVDAFCGNCGTPVAEEKNTKTSPSDRYGNNDVSAAGNFESRNANSASINNLKVIKFVKLYFTKPISFFSNLRDFDAVKTSISLLLSLSVISGLLRIWYSSAVVSNILSSIKKIPDYLAEAGIIKSSEAVAAKSNLLLAQGLVNFRQNINEMIDKKDLFLSGFIQVFALIIITSLILAALNVIILKQAANFKEVLVVSSASCIPLVIGFLIGALVTYFSLLFGIFIISFGFILYCITLYNGIRELSKESRDKIFIIMIILFVIISIISTVYLNFQLKYIFKAVSEILNEIEHIS